MQGAPDRAAETFVEDDSRPHVLVVEDDPRVRDVFVESLAPTYRLVVAENGAVGLSRAIADPPDLIITDVVMPEMDGPTMIACMRSEPTLADVPIVVVSAQDGDGLRLRLLRGSVQDFLSKPFPVEEVRARVRNLIEAKRARDLLKRELQTRETNLVALASEVARHRREAQAALAAAQAAKEVAERASRAKSNFLRVMSHELRTPITAMQLSLRLLERDAEGLSPRQQQSADRVARAYRRLLDLVDTILEYARIESGRLQLRPHTFSPRDLLRQVAAEARPQIESKGLAVRLGGPAEVPELTTDRQLLRLVLLNLLHHAVRVTAKGEIELAVAWHDGRHHLHLRDGGPQLSEEDLGELFAPHMSDDLSRRSGSGSGLGLAIVKDMVTALGGTLVATAAATGTTFRVALPPLSL